ncbi:MAG: FtsX-like permease family protein, partial [Spirochaetaceae bacterium]|nr:FtsX-like permease family protein [Spirochaetaceae bacterium]
DTIYGDDEKFQMRSRFMNRQLRFAVTNPSDLDSAAILLKEWFEKAYGEGQIAVSNPREEAAKLVARNRGISMLILFLSMAGLFIASVNVSNILMSRSLRMKKHVGILKALGASKATILKLFTGEAIFITITGSLVGMGLAFPLTRAMEGSLDLGKGSFWNILAGVGLSSILTLIFSIVPAWQNSGVNAAEAMRSSG